MKRQFLFIVAMIAMVFMACEEEKENVNNSSNSSSKKRNYLFHQELYKFDNNRH